MVAYSLWYHWCIKVLTRHKITIRYVRQWDSAKSCELYPPSRGLVHLHQWSCQHHCCPPRLYRLFLSVAEGVRLCINNITTHSVFSYCSVLTCTILCPSLWIVWSQSWNCKNWIIHTLGLGGDIVWESYYLNARTKLYNVTKWIQAKSCSVGALK